MAARKKATASRAPARKASPKKAPAPKARARGSSGSRGGGTRSSGSKSSLVSALFSPPALIGVGLGFVTGMFTQRAGAATAPAPKAPPAGSDDGGHANLPGPVPVAPAPIPTVPAPTPAPAAPQLTPKQTVERYYRRAKVAEIPRDIRVQANDYTSQPIGFIAFAKSQDNGKEYAFVLEQHSNLPPGDGGVSMFIKR